MERRLAVILATDMVGYSKLMAADEAGTTQRQKAHRTALINPEIAQHCGRIVKTTGDGMLVEFHSVVDAVKCAVEIQRAMPERESHVPDDQQIRYRIGINLGDIVIDGAGAGPQSRWECPATTFSKPPVLGDVSNKSGDRLAWEWDILRLQINDLGPGAMPHANSSTGSICPYCLEGGQARSHVDLHVDRKDVDPLEGHRRNSRDHQILRTHVLSGPRPSVGRSPQAIFIGNPADLASD